MSRHRILCIQKSNSNDLHNRIEFIGGLNPNGTRWKISQEKAIEGIENGKWEFFVQFQGTSVDVIISENVGIKYLKTKNDDINLDNLLSLPTCP